MIRSQIPIASSSRTHSRAGLTRCAARRWGRSAGRMSDSDTSPAYGVHGWFLRRVRSGWVWESARVCWVPSGRRRGVGNRAALSLACQFLCPTETLPRAAGSLSPAPAHVPQAESPQRRNTQEMLSSSTMKSQRGALPGLGPQARCACFGGHLLAVGGHHRPRSASAQRRRVGRA